jgi:hypothetical protein
MNTNLYLRRIEFLNGDQHQLPRLAQRYRPGFHLPMRQSAWEEYQP